MTFISFAPASVGFFPWDAIMRRGISATFSRQGKVCILIFRDFQFSRDIAVRSKVKAGKWIDTPDRKRYHDYICSWHFLLKQLETAGVGADAENAGMDRAKELNMALLQIFFMRPYETGKDFYEQYSMREKEFQGMLFPANCLRFV